MSATSSVHSNDNLSCDEYKLPSIEKEDRKLIGMNRKSLELLLNKQPEEVYGMQLWAREGLTDCITDLEHLGSDYGKPEDAEERSDMRDVYQRTSRLYRNIIETSLSPSAVDLSTSRAYFQEKRDEMNTSRTAKNVLLSRLDGLAGNKYHIQKEDLTSWDARLTDIEEVINTVKGLDQEDEITLGTILEDHLQLGKDTREIIEESLNIPDGGSKLSED